ncbi:MAG: sugar ABC transporter substrate-binding protein [Lachnospiraceae bacterium]|nr:sugar ABC transporter substrate-binding protein [Lachnospiraceae bacterium]
MKRKIAVLWMAMVMLGVTACGNEADQAPDTSEQTVQEGAQGTEEETLAEEEVADSAGTPAASGDALGEPVEITGEYTIGLVIDNNSDQFNHEEGEALKALAEAYASADITVAVADGGGDVMQQNQCVEDFINKRVDLIMIIPIDATGNIPAAREAIEAGIPVVTLDATIDLEDDLMYYVGASDYNAGKAQAEYLAGVLPENAQVLVIPGQEGMSNAQNRRDGAVETLTELRPDVKFLAEQPGDWDEAKCMDIVEDWCQAYPEFDAVICGGDSMALGAAEALEQAGRLDGVYITGVDCIDTVVEWMKEGKISMSAQHTAAMCAEKGFNYGLHVLAGENPEDYIWEYVAVNKENVNEFYPD